MEHNRNVIYCPKTPEHPHKKILLLLGQEEIDVHCDSHKWLKIELFQDGEPINFEKVTAKVTAMEENTYFDLDPVPTIGIGKFKNYRNKRKKSCQPS